MDACARRRLLVHIACLHACCWLTDFVVPSVQHIAQLHDDRVPANPHDLGVLVDPDHVGRPERVHGLAPVTVQVADCSRTTRWKTRGRSEEESGTRPGHLGQVGSDLTPPALDRAPIALTSHDPARRCDPRERRLRRALSEQLVDERGSGRGGGRRAALLLRIGRRQPPGLLRLDVEAMLPLPLSMAETLRLRASSMRYVYGVR